MDKLTGDAWLHVYFHYLPSLAAAWLFFSLYLVIAFFSLWQTRRYAPAGYFMYAVFGTALLEAVGYGCRAAAISLQSKSAFIAMSVLLIIPPIVLAVVNYSVLGVLLRMTGKIVWRLPPRFVSGVFQGSDILCFMIQGAAASQLVSFDINAVRLGQNIMYFGLGLQMGFFTIFLAIAMRAYHLPELHPATSAVPHVRSVWMAMWGTMALLYARNAYRVAEFNGLDKPGAYASSNEWMFYVFDGVTIFACCCAFSVWHYGILLGSKQDLVAIADASVEDSSASAIQNAEIIAVPHEPAPPKSTAGAFPI